MTGRLLPFYMRLFHVCSVQGEQYALYVYSNWDGSHTLGGDTASGIWNIGVKIVEHVILAVWNVEFRNSLPHFCLNGEVSNGYYLDLFRSVIVFIFQLLK